MLAGWLAGWLGAEAASSRRSNIDKEDAVDLSLWACTETTKESRSQMGDFCSISCIISEHQCSGAKSLLVRCGWGGGRMAVVNPKSGHEPRIQRPFRWLLADDGRWMGHSAGRIFYERKIRIVLKSRRSLLLVYRWMGRLISGLRRRRKRMRRDLLWLRLIQFGVEEV